MIIPKFKIFRNYTHTGLIFRILWGHNLELEVENSKF